MHAPKLHSNDIATMYQYFNIKTDIFWNFENAKNLSNYTPKHTKLHHLKKYRRGGGMSTSTLLSACNSDHLNISWQILHTLVQGRLGRLLIFT